MQLNPQQKAAVTAPHTGIHLVQALAGSGKTTLLRYRTKYLLRARDAEGEYCSKILIMAYNKGVQQTLEEKLEEDLSVIDFKRTLVKTFHGISYMLVLRFYKDHLPELKAKPGIQSNSSHLVTMASDWMDANGIKKLKASNIKMLIALEEKSNMLNKTILQVYAEDSRTAMRLNMKIGEIEYYCDVLKKFRYETGNLVFTDLLVLANKLPDECYKSMGFEDVLVDELQDLNHQQRQLIYKFIPHAKQFTGVGDPHQSIYSFQGCDARIFETIKEQYPQAILYPLTTNYRCSDEILEVANKVLKNDIKASNLLVGTNRSQSIPDVRYGASQLVDWIKTRVAGGSAYSDIAILYRARAHTPDLEIALAEAGIPFTVDSNSFFEQTVVQDILAYFYLMYHPKAEYGYFRHITNHFFGIGPTTAEIMWKDTKGRPLTWDPADLPKTIRSDRRSAWNKFMSTLSKYESLAGDPGKLATRISEDLYDRWAYLFGDNLQTLDYHLDIAKVFCEWVAKYGADGFRVVQTIEMRAAGKTDDQNVVQVNTVHSSKGKEWPCVGVWGLKDGMFPLSSGEHDEELRLLYVSVTRAQDHLALIGVTELDRASTLLRHLNKEI
jgi:DNA helicase-2/ATP-dependent DNA helicase PcrA